MTLVAVTSDIYVRAVHRPGYKSRTYDWRVPAIPKHAAPPENTARIEPACTVLPIGDALVRQWKTDAHMFAYHVPGCVNHPRLAKDVFDASLEHPQGWWSTTGLPIPQVDLFCADVDNPDHAAWTPELIADFERLFATSPSLATAGVYFTRRGWRILQPLAAPLPITVSERYHHRWLYQLEREGVVVDWAAKDWTRYWRLPNVVRDRQPYRSPVIRLERMVPIHLAELPALDPVVAPTPAPRRTAPTAAPPVSTDALPARLERLVNALAAPLRAIGADWHDLFLVLAGALLQRNVPADAVPALIARISTATYADDRTDDRVTAARSTLARHSSGLSIAGVGVLRRRWPAVAHALESALRPPSRAATRPETLDANAASDALVNAIRAAGQRHGVSLVGSDCGLGKTRAAMVVARERAAHKPDASRAPAGTRTSISVPTTALSEQITTDLRAAGVPTKRVFGPLSVIEHNVPVCRYYDAASAMQSGGHSVRYEFCEGRGKQPCEHLQTCPAALGENGPDDARVVVGPHGLLSALDGVAGVNGLLVLDEPPALLETAIVTLDQIAAAEAQLASYAPPYAAVLSPLLRPLAAWVREIGPCDDLTAGSTPPSSCSLSAALDAATDVFDPDDVATALVAAKLDSSATVLEAVRAVAKPNRAPPLRFVQLQMARRSPPIARQLGAASRVLSILARAADPSSRAALRIVTDTNDARVLAITLPRADLEAALRRDGSVVLLDANIAQHAPVVTRVVGYDPPTTTVAALDGAPIERTHLDLHTANRRQWFCRRRPVWSAGIASALTSVIDWALEDPNARALGLITYKPIAAALQWVQSRDEHLWVAQAHDAHVTDGDLAEARAVLGPILARWPYSLRLAHYGSVRGLNSFAEVDALATLGDPWSKLDVVRHDAAFLDLPDAEQRIEDLARAELEQAHGRLRTIHRTRPGRALHVGRILPSGTGWAGTVHVRHAQVGRRANAPGVDLARLRALVDALGGSTVVARTTGVSRMTLHRYLTGERNAGAAFLAQLERLEPPPTIVDRGAPIPPQTPSPQTPPAAPTGSTDGHSALSTLPPTSVFRCNRIVCSSPYTDNSVTFGVQCGDLDTVLEGGGQ